MIADKDTNIVYFSELLLTDSRFSETCKQIINVLDSFGIKKDFLPHTNDIWARDYMPIQISDEIYIEFRYDPDYLQGTRKGSRNLKTYTDIVCDSIKLNTVKSDIILDGGNVVKSKDSIILTEKIVRENRLLCNKVELIKRLRKVFGVEKIILIPWDTKEVFGHADGMLRFIDETTVLINQIYLTDRKLLNQLRRYGLKWEVLECSVKKKDKRNWAYINFLQTKDLILLPKFNIDEDDQALDYINKYFPDYSQIGRVVQIDMTEIVKYGGALNCITWTKKE